MLDETSNVTLYTGSRMYLSSSLELAPDAYYASGSNWYQVGTGNPYGYNMGTIIVSGSCPLPPPTPTATFSHSSGTNTSTSGVGLTTINPTITVTNGPVTIRLRITVITGFRGNTTLIIPGYGSFSPTPQPEGTGDSTFLDITLVNGIYYCTWEINAISQGEFTLVQSFLTQI
jgi:hypothetical protein